MPLFGSSKSSKKKVEDDSSSKKDYTYHLSMLDFYTANLHDKNIFMNEDQFNVARAMMNVLLEYKTTQLNTIIVKLKTVEDNNKIKALLKCLHTLNQFKYLIDTLDNDEPKSNDEKKILNSMKDYIKDKVNVAAKQVVNSLIVFNPSELDGLNIIDKFSFGEEKDDSDTADMTVALANDNMVGLLKRLKPYKNETKKFWNGYASTILDYKHKKNGKYAEDYTQAEIDNYLEGIERDNTDPGRPAAIEAVIEDNSTYVVNGPADKSWGGRTIKKRGRRDKRIRVKGKKVRGVYRSRRKKK